MSEENKPKVEYSGLEQDVQSQSELASTEASFEDGVIIEQEISPAEREAIMHELEQQAPAIEESEQEEVSKIDSPTEQASNLETIAEADDTKHVEEKLHGDNDFDNITTAHDTINAYMRGEIKP